MEKWRIDYIESERGWGQNYWSVDFDTEEDALSAYEQDKPKAGPTPDYYIIPQKPPYKVYVGKHTKENTDAR